MTLSKSTKKLVWTASIVVLLILISFPGSRTHLFEKHLFRNVDSKATEYVDSGFDRALVAFAVARTFNAVVSVIQDSELQLEPGGIGVSLALGQALDPINDLVERFSWVMLASLTSFGIQKVLIQITPFVSIQIFLVLALLTFIVGLWLPAERGASLRHAGKILLFFAVLLRFAVPIMAYLNHVVYTSFLEQKHNQAIHELKLTSSELKTKSLSDFSSPKSNEVDLGPAAEEGWLSRTKKSFNQVIDRGKKAFNLPEKIMEIENKASAMIERIVDLIIVFVLSAIVLPLLFLWGILKLGRLMVSRGFFSSFLKP